VVKPPQITLNVALCVYVQSHAKPFVVHVTLIAHVHAKHVQPIVQFVLFVRLSLSIVDN
jgi:hypothetical protein